MVPACLFRIPYHARGMWYGVCVHTQEIATHTQGLNVSFGILQNLHSFYKLQFLPYHTHTHTHTQFI
ncbi:hypothetical protein EON63_20670 [archaeon]|nr:MAG: hypothetical protein EON63_20670 [archaeon]